MMGSCLITVLKGQGGEVIERIEEHNGAAELLSDEERAQYASAGDLLQSSDCDVVRAFLPPGLLVHDIFGNALKRVL